MPAELAAKAGTGVPNRVVPDISMEGDPSTGMLVGETQEFADGTYYDQYRIGGTSLASPLFAGLMADADQAARGSLGFVNPLLYHLDAGGQNPGAFYDILPAGKQAVIRNDYLNGENAEAGILTSARILGMEGATEYFCPRTERRNRRMRSGNRRSPRVAVRGPRVRLDDRHRIPRRPVHRGTDRTLTHGGRGRSGAPDRGDGARRGRRRAMS